VTELRLVDTDPTRLAADAVVIGVHQGGRGSDSSPLTLAAGSDQVAAAFSGRGADLVGTLRQLAATGTVGEVTKIATFGTVAAPVVAAVGLGKLPASGTPDPRWRRAAASAVRALAGSADVALALPVTADAPALRAVAEGTLAEPGVADSLALRAVAEGALLGAYRFAGYRTRPEPSRFEPVGSVAVCVADVAEAATSAAIARSATVAAAVAMARDWVNAAPNELRPPRFAELVSTAAGAVGIAVEVLDERALADGGFGGILAVGGGSSAPPRLVKLAYRPEGATTDVALVGKGITFDSGGISIKPALGMWEMKADMAGAAGVAAAMVAIASLRLPVAVTAYLPMAENMPSGTAYRPGDVVRMRSGKQVEVLNTDAEGRMILADAIALAAESSPDFLIETSTLTGGQVISLGKRVSGVMGTPELCERIRTAGERAGEPAWPMPLPEDVRSGMDSDVADISQVNAGMDRAGHMLQGGVFLSEFVPDGLAWAHLDIAGPAYHSGDPTGDWSKGATGVPVKLLVELVEGLATAG
jgi:leucyl aminopeptidase